VRKRTLKATSPTTVRQAWQAWLAGAREGSIRTRSGDVYKPSVIRSYDSSMRLHVLDELGADKLGDVSRLELQDLADRLLAAGLDPSTIRNALMPLRVVFRRAVSRGELGVNPATGLELPAVRGRRDRIASPEQAAKLIAAAPEDDRAIWATAAYAGLRCGELQALEHDDLDLGAGVIHVRRSWDPREGAVEPKSRAGTRDVPIAAALRVQLAAHLLRSPRRSGLVFGKTETAPFDPRQLAIRAERAWTAAELTPIGLQRATAHLRLDLYRRRREREGAFDVPRPRLDLDHARQVRPPDARQRGRGDRPRRRLLERTTGAFTGAKGPQAAPLSQS